MYLKVLEGEIVNGQIRLLDNANLPEGLKVYVIIPNMDEVPSAYIVSPRQLHPEQAADFRKEVIEES